MNFLEHLRYQGGCRSVCPAKQDHGAGRTGPIPQPPREVSKAGPEITARFSQGSRSPEVHGDERSVVKLESQSRAQRQDQVW